MSVMRKPAMMPSKKVNGKLAPSTVSRCTRNITILCEEKNEKATISDVVGLSFTCPHCQLRLVLIEEEAPTGTGTIQGRLGAGGKTVKTLRHSLVKAVVIC